MSGIYDFSPLILGKIDKKWGKSYKQGGEKSKSEKFIYETGNIKDELVRNGWNRWKFSIKMKNIKEDKKAFEGGGLRPDAGNAQMSVW